MKSVFSTIASTRRAVMKTQIALALAAWVAATLFPTQTRASDSFVATTLEDTKLYFTAPLRWDEEDWLYFGGALVAIGAAHSFDERVRDHFATGSKAVLNGGKDTNTLRDAAPTIAIVAGTGLYAAFIDDREGYRETWALIEAGAFSGATAEVLGYATGRERPDATTSPNAWGNGGNDSFPSLHTTVAFAVGTVFAESGNDEYRWIRRIIGYGVAGATAYVRVDDNVHWLSDTVAGAAIGIATAKFVLNRQDAQNRGTVQFQPVKGGWMVSYAIRTH
jgi:hypothetical protein